MLNTTHEFRHEPDYSSLRRTRTALLIIWLLFVAYGLVEIAGNGFVTARAAAERIERASR